MATNVTISIIKGDSLNYEIPILNSAGTAYSFTTETVICKVKEAPTSSTALLSLTTADNSIVKASGKITLVKTTPALAVGTYFYDIQITFVNSQIETIQSGIFEVLQDIS